MLTPEGEARAENLTQIHSTNYRRTLETAAPIAEQTGFEVALYDPRDLSGFADELRASKGVHLVVGHSIRPPNWRGP
ncbi:MAG: histidine phosphatase family protein [Pseudomonadota bacterium]